MIHPDEIELLGGPYNGRWIRVPRPLPDTLILPRAGGKNRTVDLVYHGPVKQPEIPVSRYERGVADDGFRRWPVYRFRLI